MSSIDKVINGSTGIIGKIWNTITGKTQQNEWAQDQWSRESAFAEHQADVAYNRQRQLIAEQRAYDAPANQMQRLVDAGLNPDLIYGQLNPSLMANNPDMGVTPHGGFASGSNNPIGDVSGAILNIASSRLADANANKANKELDKIDAETKYTLHQMGLTDAQIVELHYRASLEEAQYSTELAKYNLLDEQARSVAWDNYFKEDTYNDRVSQVASAAKIDKERAEKITQVIDASIAESLGSAHASEAAARLSDAEIPLKNALKDYYVALKNKTNVETALAKLEYQFKDYYGDAEIARKLINMVTNSPHVALSGFMSSLEDYDLDKRGRSSVKVP